MLSIGLSLPCFFLCEFSKIILFLELDTSKAMLETGRYNQQKLGINIGSTIVRPYSTRKPVDLPFW